MLQVKKIFGLLLFASLILLKVSAFHVYTHQDADCEAIHDCEICDLVLDYQTSDLDVPTPLIPEINHVVSIEEVIDLKPESFPIDSRVYLLFSRPPPC